MTGREEAGPESRPENGEKGPAPAPGWNFISGCKKANPVKKCTIHTKRGGVV
jgi:hypothetical protein